MDWRSSDAWLNDHYERIFEACHAEIKPIPGAREVLENLSDSEIPFCLASQGPIRKMLIPWGATGMWPLVDGNVYSATMVERPKPTPDLFLYAAAAEGYLTDDCIVVEDSATGVKAAVAAQMKVIGFAADDTDAPALADTGAQSIISDMDMLMPPL